MNNILSDLVKRYANGEKLSDLEKESGIYRQKIIRALRNSGISLRGSKSFSEDIEKEIVFQYKNGSKTKFLSTKYKVSTPCIISIIKRHGLIVRPNNEENRIYFVDELYFDAIDREEKAYILGLLYADGCNTGKRVVLGLTGNSEKNLLDKIGKLLYNGKFPIGYWEKTKSWRLTIVNKKFAERLVNLGVVPRKSLILKFPSTNIISELLVKHFIRGYFDGDGSIMLQRENTRHIISFVGTFDFLSILKGILFKFNIYGNVYKASSPSKKLFDFRIQDRKSVDTFYHLMYDDATIWLSRKKDKFLERKLHEKYRDSSGRRGRFIKSTSGPKA